MIKVPLYEIPDIYANDVQKEKALTASPDDLKIPGTYVQDVTQARASKEMIPPIIGKSNPSTNFSLDDDYMPLAERYDAGIATESETERLQADVSNAAKEAIIFAIMRHTSYAQTMDYTHVGRAEKLKAITSTLHPV